MRRVEGSTRTSTLDDLMTIVGTFRTGMLVTRDTTGDLRARPLNVAACESNGRLWFVTSRRSGKTEEVRLDERGAVVFQGKLRYASIAVRCEVVDDRAKRRELFERSWRPWLAGRPDDPDVVLLRADVEGGEYWDLHGMRGVQYFAKAVGALVRGEKMPDEGNDASYHGAVVPKTTATRDGAAP